MKWALPLFAQLFVTGVTTVTLAASPAPFRLHLTSEPTQIDPHRQKSSASSYLIQNLFRNLFTYQDAQGLIPDLGEKCHREKKGQQLVCRLKKNLQWSDGSELTAGDFVAGYRRLLNPELKAPRADLLFHLKNAKAIYEGKTKDAELGVTAKDKWTLVYEFSEPDPDFEYNLATALLSPVKMPWKEIHADNATQLVVNGPYRIARWEAGRRIQLETNPHYQGGEKSRPPVEFLFVDDDGVALKLFEKNELDFLRRLPTLHIPKYKGSPEFHWIDMLRFDYVGFGPALKNRPDLRRALTESLRFEEMQALFHSDGRPGCAGIPPAWFASGKAPCFEMNPEARKLIGKDPAPSLTYMFSQLGGEDHRRGSEWLQEQWRQNLGLKVAVKSMDNKMYLNQLRDDPPPIFRKGIAVDRPTCLATLETFTPDNPENFLRVKDEAFFKVVKDLALAPNEKRRKELCEKGVRLLMDSYTLIPMGWIHFAVLAKPQFSGWMLNQMGQMDLAGLKAATDSPGKGTGH